MKENENEKILNINFDEYINKAKEKLIQIRNNNNINNNINTKRKLKTTLNYILRENGNDNYNYNHNYNIIEDEPIEKEKNILNNLKSNYENNKLIIKKSNRLQNFITNIKEVQNRNNNFKVNEKKNQNNSNNIYNDIPNIKSIVDKKKLEVFDEDEFIKIKKRNFSSNKINSFNINQDLKYLDKTLKLQNIYQSNYNDNIEKKILINKDILPPNNFDFKDIFNKTLMNNIRNKK